MAAQLLTGHSADVDEFCVTVLVVPARSLAVALSEVAASTILKTVWLRLDKLPFNVLSPMLVVGSTRHRLVAPAKPI